MQIYKVNKRVYHILINEIDIIFLRDFNKKNQTGKKKARRMRMKRKIIFLDIDGTLTQPGSNEPPESAVWAIA